MSLWSPALHSSDCCTNHSTPARYWVCGHLHYIHQTAAQTTQLLPDTESVVTCITFIRLLLKPLNSCQILSLWSPALHSSDCCANHSTPARYWVCGHLHYIHQTAASKPLNSCQILSLWSTALHSSDCRTNHSTPARYWVCGHLHYIHQTAQQTTQLLPDTESVVTCITFIRLPHKPLNSCQILSLWSPALHSSDCRTNHSTPARYWVCGHLHYIHQTAAQTTQLLPDTESVVTCITFIRLPHKPLNSCQILSLWSPALHSSDCRTNHSTPARYWVCGHLHYIHQTAAQTTQLLPDNESVVTCITFIRLPLQPLNSCQIMSLWSPALHSSDCCSNHSTPARYWVCGHLHYIHQTAAQTTQLLPDTESVVTCITFIRLLHKPLNSCQIMSLWSPALHSSDCCSNHSTPARYWVCGHLHYIHQTAAQTTQLLPDTESVVTCITFIRLLHKPLNSCQIMSLWSPALHSSDCWSNHSTPAR